MDSSCIKQTVCKVLNIFQHGKYLVAYVLNAGQKYEHSAILSTFIKLPFDVKIFVLPYFEWPLKTGFTVL